MYTLKIITLNKFLFAFIITFTSYIAFGQNKETFLQTVYSEVRVQAVNDIAYQKDWNHECISQERLLPFIQDLFDAIESGLIELHEAQPAPFNKPSDMIGDLISDTLKFHPALYESEEYEDVDMEGNPLYDEFGYPLIMIQYYRRDITRVVALGFIEDWYLSETDSSIIKKVRWIAPVIIQKDNNGDIKGTRNLGFIKIKSNEKSHLLTDHISSDFHLVHDVTSEWWNNNLEYSTRFNLLSPLFKKAQDGKQLYFIDKRNFEEINKDIGLFNTLKEPMLDENGDQYYNGDGEYLTIDVKIPLVFNTVSRLRFHERWYVDLRKGMFSKEVQGIELGGKNEDNSDPEESKTWDVWNFYLPLEEPKKTFADPDFKKAKVNYTLSFNDTLEKYSRSAIVHGTDRTRLKAILAQQLEFVTTGKLLAKTDSWKHPKGRPLTKEEKQQFTKRKTVVYNKEDRAKDETTYSVLSNDEIFGLNFTENWHYNQDKQTFKKVAITTSPVTKSYDHYECYHKTLIKHELIGKDITYVVNVNAGKYGSDALKDIINSGQYHDQLVHESIGFCSNNLYPELKYSFVNMILKQIQEGKLKAYESYDSKKKLKWEQIEANFALKELKQVPRLNGYRMWELVDTTFNSSYLSSLEFVEDWYLDTLSGAIIKEVKGITFLASTDSIEYETQSIDSLVNSRPCTNEDCYHGTWHDDSGNDHDCSVCNGVGMLCDKIIPKSFQRPVPRSSSKQLFYIRLEKE
ncbi:MAG: hypothetical protein ACI9J3_001411 [Parvicellaceae bacterium]|jgi:hypothetical protein